jgi:hypothetical protein
MAEAVQTGVGGPLDRLERRAHVERLGRLVPILIAITWLPLTVFTLAEWILTRAPEPLLRDASVHARLLVAVPLFVAADRLLDQLCRISIRRLFDEGYLAPDAAVRLRDLLRRVITWRDSALAETILLAGALLLGVAALVGLIPPAGRIHGIVESPYGIVRIWYGLVALPAFQFLLWRTLFHWALWLRVLVCISRLRLRLLPGHADRRGGIAFLREPSVAYGGVMLLAASSVICAGWATQTVLYSTPIDAFRALFAGFLLVAFVLTVAPLLLFVPRLVQARFNGRRRFGGLVSDYTNRFEARWVDRADRPDLLGTSDIQSFADLSTAYRENIERMQVLLFTPRDAIVLLVAAFLPAIPLLFLQAPAQEVIRRILKLVTGGMP